MRKILFYHNNIYTMYKQKYLKYKQKYLANKMLGGSLTFDILIKLYNEMIDGSGQNTFDDYKFISELNTRGIVTMNTGYNEYSNIKKAICNVLYDAFPNKFIDVNNPTINQLCNLVKFINNKKKENNGINILNASGDGVGAFIYYGISNSNLTNVHIAHTHLSSEFKRHKKMLDVKYNIFICGPDEVHTIHNMLDVISNDYDVIIIHMNTYPGLDPVKKTEYTEKYDLIMELLKAKANFISTDDNRFHLDIGYLAPGGIMIANRYLDGLDAIRYKAGLGIDGYYYIINDPKILKLPHDNIPHGHTQIIDPVTEEYLDNYVEKYKN